MGWLNKIHASFAKFFTKLFYQNSKTAGLSDDDTLHVTAISEKSGVRKLKIGIVGESQYNEDGIARQFLIASLKPGHVIRLVREPENPHDANAIAIYCRRGKIGYFKREHARQLAAVMDSGAGLRAEVANIWGGTPGKPTRGVWIWVWDDPKADKGSAKCET